jgi:hypothetical protein
VLFCVSEMAEILSWGGLQCFGLFLWSDDDSIDFLGSR